MASLSFSLSYPSSSTSIYLQFSSSSSLIYHQTDLLSKFFSLSSSDLIAILINNHYYVILLNPIAFPFSDLFSKNYPNHFPKSLLKPIYKQIIISEISTQILPFITLLQIHSLVTSKSFQFPYSVSLILSLPNQIRLRTLKSANKSSLLKSLHHDPEATPYSKNPEHVPFAYKTLCLELHLLHPSHHNSKRRNPKSKKAASPMEDQITLAISRMTLGAYDPPTTVSEEVQIQAQIQGQHSIVVRRLHHTQNAYRLRDLLVDLWKLEDKKNAIVQEYGTILTTFANEVRMLDILNNEPWYYRGWFIAIDLWTNRFEDNFLEEVMLWVKLTNVPGDYKNDAALMEFGKKVGIPVKTKIRQNSWGIGTDCLVLVRFNIHNKLKFVQRFTFPPEQEPVFIHYEYEKLRYYCTECGSILHIANECPLRPPPAQGNNPQPPHDDELPQLDLPFNQALAAAPIREYHPHRSNQPALLQAPIPSAAATLPNTTPSSGHSSPKTLSAEPRQQNIPQRPTVGVLRIKEAPRKKDGQDEAVNQMKDSQEPAQVPRPIQSIEGESSNKRHSDKLKHEKDSLEPLSLADFPQLELPPLNDKGLQELNQEWPLAMIPVDSFTSKDNLLIMAPFDSHDKAIKQILGQDKHPIHEASDSSATVDEELEADTPPLIKKAGKQVATTAETVPPRKRRTRARVVKRNNSTSTQGIDTQDLPTRKRKTQDASASFSTRQVKSKATPIEAGTEGMGQVAPQKPPVIP